MDGNLTHYIAGNIKDRYENSEPNGLFVDELWVTFGY